MMEISEPKITVSGADTIADASALRIAAAPTEGTRNYALWVDAGDSRFDGNVGIGETSPGYKLTVNGTAWCTSGAWSGSDIRWKENIITLNNPLHKILKLRGVQYDWKREEFKDHGFPEGRQIGIIAQELEKEFPELVTTTPRAIRLLPMTDLPRFYWRQ